MAALEQLLSHGIVERLGWTLIHFIWQASLIALLLAVVLRMMRRRSAAARYIVSCLALALIFALPLVTMRLIDAPGPIAEVGPVAPPMPVVEPQPVEVIEVAELPIEPVEAPVLEAPEATVSVPWKQRAIDAIEPALPWLVLGWLLGVFGLSAWHLGGWAQLQRMRRRMVGEVAAPVRAKLAELAEHLGIRQAVGLLESALVEVPTVVGWIKPVILLPASVLTGLDNDQLEAILAHELAHVRRYDYLVNILQSVVEILGFYHPAVWWVSHRIRAERENCCDDLAVRVCGDSVRYARALTCLEEMRHHQTELAVAANGGSLVARIGRLLGRPAPAERRFAWLPGLVALLLVAATIIPTALVLAVPDPSPFDSVVSELPLQEEAEIEECEEPDRAQLLISFVIADIFTEQTMDRETAEQARDLLRRIRSDNGGTRHGRSSGSTAPANITELRRPLGEVLSVFEAESNKGKALLDLLVSRGHAEVIASPKILKFEGERGTIGYGDMQDPNGSAMELGVLPHVGTHSISLTIDFAARHVSLNGEDGQDVTTLAMQSNLVTDDGQDVLLTDQEEFRGENGSKRLRALLVHPEITFRPGVSKAEEPATMETEPVAVDTPTRTIEREPSSAPRTRQDATRPHQVFLDFHTVVIEHKDLTDLDIEWSSPQISAGVFGSVPSAGPGEANGWPWGVRIGYTPDRTSTSALQAALDRLTERGRAKLLARQQVMAIDGRMARVTATTDESFLLEDPDLNDELVTITSGIVSTATPRIGDNNDITLELAVEYSDSIPSEGGSKLPRVTRRTTRNTVTFKDGGTVALAGLSEQNGDTEESVMVLVTARLTPENITIHPKAVRSRPSTSEQLSGEPAQGRVLKERQDDRSSPTDEQTQILLDVKILTVPTDRALSPEAAMGLSNLWDWTVKKRRTPRIRRRPLPSVEDLQIPPAQVLERCAVDGQADSDLLGAMIELLKPLKYMKLVSNPQILAQNNRETQLRVMTEEYYMLSEAGATEPFESGIRANITPHVEDGDHVTLAIDTVISDVTISEDARRKARISKNSLTTTATLDRETTLILRVTPGTKTLAEEDDILYVLIQTQTLSNAPIVRTEAKTVTASFDKTRLVDALTEIAIQTGAKIGVDIQNNSSPVTVELKGLSAEAALETVLKGTGYAFRDTGNGYSVFPLVTATFQGADLREALMEVGRRAGVTVVSHPKVSGEVWAELRDVPIEEALNRLLAGSPFAVKVTPDYYLVADPKEQTADRNATNIRMVGGANDPAQHGMGRSQVASRKAASRVTATFNETSLLDAIEQIGTQADVKLAVDATVKPIPITARIEDLTVPMALQVALARTGYTFRAQGSSYLVYRPITATFMGEDLRQALQDVAMQAKVTIVVDPNVAGEAYAEFQSVPLGTALSIMLAGSPFTVQVTPDYYLVVPPERRTADLDRTSIRMLGGANDPARHGTAGHIHLDLTVMEVATQAKLDRQAAAEASKGLSKSGSDRRAWRPSELRKRTVGELLESLYHDAPAESFEAFVDLLVSRGYIDLLMNPTLVAVEGRQTQIGVPGKGKFAVVATTEDNGRTVRLDANLDLDIRTPLATTNDSNVDPENAPVSVKTVRSHVTLRADNQGCALQPLAGNDNSTFYLLARPEVLPTKASARVTATFNGTSLLDAIEEIGAQADVKLAVDATVKPIPIIAKVDDLGVEEALHVILKKTGYTAHYNPQEGLTRIFRPITATFQGEELREAVRAVAALADVSIICDPAVAGKIYADLEGVSLKKALDTLLAASPYVARPEEDGSFWVVPRDEPADTIARQVDTGWSEAQEGVRLRLRAEKRTWRADEIPSLRWDVKNAGAREFLHVAEGQRLTQLEVDGVWYAWPPNSWPVRLADLGVGQMLSDQRITLSPIWSKAKAGDLGRDNNLARVVYPAQLRTSLQLTPGEHTIRVAVIAEPSRARTGGLIRVVSPPVNVTIASSDTSLARSWPPSPELSRAFKEMMASANLIVTRQMRPNQAQMSEWIAQAFSHAVTTAELAKGTPLQTSVTQMVSALAALRKAVDTDITAAGKEFNATTRACHNMVRVFSGESHTGAVRSQEAKDGVRVQTRVLHVSDELLEELVEDPNTSEELAAALTLGEEKSMRKAVSLDDAEIEFLLRAAQRDKQSRSLASPAVTVLDGEGAEMRLARAVPQFVGFSEPNESSDEPVAQYESIEVGVEFNFTAHLQKGSEDIFLDAKAKITSLLGQEERVHEGKYPYTFPIISTVETQTAVTTSLDKTVLISSVQIESLGQAEPFDQAATGKLLILIQTQRVPIYESETPPAGPPRGLLMGGMGGGMMGGFPPGEPPLPPGEKK